MSEVRIYFEGDPALRQGFVEFFKELTATLGRAPKFIAGKANPFQVFLWALKDHPDALNILLVDSEGPDDGKLFESICHPRGIDVRSNLAVAEAVA